MSDGSAKIEERVDEVITKMFERVAAVEEEARISEERRARAIAYLREKDKPRQEAEFHERRGRNLQTEARQWRRAQALRDYLVAAEKIGIRAGRASHASEDSWRAWINWAHEYVGSLDPIVQGKAGVAPPYPEPREFGYLPHEFLECDDPAEAYDMLKPHKSYLLR